jgi:glycosyltransferase involved in cell wall biosynthesis
VSGGPDRASGLVVSLDGRLEQARAAARAVDPEADPRLVSFSRLFASDRPRALDWLAAAGSPPEDEIGYGMLTAAAALLRPRRVVLADLRDGTLRQRPLVRHLAASAPTAATQLAASAAALAAQQALLAWLERTPPTLTRGSDSLGGVAYLRALGGYSAAVGGSVTHTLEVVRALRQEGIRVDCATSDAQLARTAAEEPDGDAWRVAEHARSFDAVPASYAVAGDLALVREALPLARAADVVYQRHARFSLAGAMLSRLTGKPLFLEYNSPGNFLAEDPAPFAAIRRRTERAVLAAAARVIVVSEHGREMAIRQGVDSERVAVNPNGVDVDRFGGSDRDATRSALGLAADDFVVGFTGSFLSFHGVPVLARAFCELAAAEPRARLLLAGDGDERAEVERILADGGAADRALLLGSVDRGRIPALLDASDALASPHVEFADGSAFFGSPTKLFEYMAAGRPIVASRLGQIGDVLEDGRNALLVPPGDAGALTGALRRLADDAPLRERLAVSARADAAERHTWRHNARRIAAAYAALPAEHP